MPIQNVMTVDVEDYFQVSAFAESIKPDEWDKQPLRVENNTLKLLELFDEYNIKATFFVLGWVAERQKKLVAEIAARGHEVACHGYSHQLVYNQTPEIFKQETVLAKNILEDIIQQPVKGYRAASYSITEKSLWALDILAESGFIYDSSIFPVRHDRYGMPDTPKHPYKLKTPAGHSIIEFPLSTAKVLNYRLPVAGGGYFRLYPYWLSKAGLAQINRQKNPFIFYLHPWEVDPQQPRISASWFSRFRHYNNLDKCESRLRRLMMDFQFTTSLDVLSNLGLIDSAASQE
ncbi:FIG004655: Polysaccharide deacetylase [hydrothermal vent metagenome]|uniref:FIG004655: Polysaccharide deacetylase n=1 Tax=hydrothermal vent metagenome TaxID=652676 RepID=A0A3B0WZS9_9ZZZZ